MLDQWTSGAKAAERERRWKVMHVSPEALFWIARGDCKVIDKGDVIDGLLVVGVRWEPMLWHFEIIVAHETFEVVPEGQALERMRGPTFKTVDKQGRT